MSFYKYPRTDFSSLLTPLDELEGQSENIRKAVTMLTDLRDHIESIPQDLKANYPMDSIAPSILYAVMDYAPLVSARDKVAQDILHCASSLGHTDAVQEGLIKLATHYANHLIGPFRSTQGQTSNVSSHPSCLLSDTERMDISGSLTPGHRAQARIKALALKRDESRCMASGIPHMPSNKSRSIRPRNRYLKIRTEAAHIIPFHLVNLQGSEFETKTDYPSAFWKIVGWFGHVKWNKLDGQKINSLENVLTLSQGIHTSFDRLDLWFEEMEGHPNRYRIQCIDPGHGLALHVREEVKWTTSDPANLPLPDPAHLRLHATCAKIAHMSGISELMDNWDDEVETMGVLATDGSSMGLLASRLAALSESFSSTTLLV